ncbi:isopentenyl transferase family protein [Devosia sp. MC521]|uniref:isopentenyl transferase family protein n=1 Tax=Devosia sp. MC521 TaxID=2759954 RepID=UPI0015F818FD|nr:isopentenyl transferase family protein [Devosia sp. MC521]MBJ6985981.1 AAA family ATPase [Devosia sp. MC521]QMW61352.1 AAA family ATPase [Devosia sp. MC521]
MHIPPLSDFGNRIMILGPTNAGKSTFTIALANKLGVPAIHLDRYRHLPNTMYEQRPDADFKALHDEAAALDGWVMDGSYSAHFPVRLPRTTGIIVLDANLQKRVSRYIWRTMFQKDRPGGLEGNQDKLTLEMFRWLWTTRDRTVAVRDWVKLSGKPYVFTRNPQETAALYAAWNLKNPHA